jgi:outer membrane autotransporter protein
MSAALYATTYSRSGLYLDAIANYARSDHDSLRRIEFTEAGTGLDLSANGATSGSTVGLTFNLGYDFTPGAFTIAPSVGYNYLASSIDAFRERGAAGLDLEFDDQSYSSATANAGLRMSYAWKTPVGVLQPQIRGEYIRELFDGTETFTARFANDPFDDTPRIVVTSDVADRSYWRLAGGLAAQFAHGIAGFVEYQTFESLRYVSYSDVAVGLRIETAFR